MNNHQSHFELRTSTIIKIFKDHQSHNYDRILDVGCNDGILSMDLKSALGARYIYGIDLDKEKLKKAQERGVDTFFLDIDKDDLPFDADYFDAVFAGDVIEHLVDVDHFLAELYRTLKPDGILVISTPNLACWYNRLAFLLGFQPFWTDVSIRNPNAGKLLKTGPEGGGEHIHVFTPKALRETAETHNFTFIKKATPYIGLGFNSFAFRLIERLMCVLGWGSSQFIVLTK